MDKKVKKVVLAYSGGLDTSVILTWLREQYDCEVVAFAADLGQNEDLSEIEEKAAKTGASKTYVEDLQEEFVRDYVFPMMRASAVYENYYLMGTAIARPLIAKKQMEIAKLEGADTVSHGSTGKGNDQVRFELTYYRFDPTINVVTPWRIWDMKSRTDLVNYCESRKIPISVTKDKPYSMDRNILHISYEGGILEDPWSEPPENMFQLSVSPEKAPNEPEYVEIEFLKGNPIKVNGEELSPAQLLHKLNKLGGKHGIGRVDLVENRYVGMKSRGVYETPGGTIIYHAHRALESLTLDREVMHFRDGLIPKYSELVYYGYWFSPERETLQVYMDEVQKTVTGTIRLKLYKGNLILAGRKSNYSLYNKEIVTFEEDHVYNQFDAEGFIKINSLRLKTDSIIKKD